MEKNTVFTNKTINFKDESFNERKYPFWVQDTYGWVHDIFDNITYCSQIYIPNEDRRKGIGSKLLQDFIKENIGDNNLYFVQAGFSSLEYSEEEYNAVTIEDMNILFDNLDNFYTKNGFFNINIFIGNYEESRMYLYTNEAAIKLLEKILKSDLDEYRLFDLTLDNNIYSRFTVSKMDGSIIQDITYKKYDKYKMIAEVYNYNSDRVINELKSIDTCTLDMSNILFTNNLSISVVKLNGMLRYSIKIIRKNNNIINSKEYIIGFK